jgi:hypothetical protein
MPSRPTGRRDPGSRYPGSGALRSTLGGGTGTAVPKRARIPGLADAERIARLHRPALTSWMSKLKRGACLRRADRRVEHRRQAGFDLPALLAQPGWTGAH